MNLQKRSRRRGVILTSQGLKKLDDAKSFAENSENSHKRYTLETLSIRTGLDSDTLIKVFAGKVGVDKRTLTRCFKAFNLSLQASDYQFAQPDAAISTQYPIENSRSKIPDRIDWGEAPDVSVFYGRTEELATLTHWILEERCRLVTLFGMGGMGKTSLSVKLAQQIEESFEFVIWRSLRNAPPIKDLLAQMIQFLANQQENASTAILPLSDTVDGNISQLMSYLRKHRCLLILDHGESILGSGNRTGTYREGYEGYGQLFRCVGETSHQSCLILTTREKPKWLAPKEGQTLPVRSLKLTGLQLTEIKAILQSQGCCCKSPLDCSHCDSEMGCYKLMNYYAGNPLALKLVSTTIYNLFDGRISEFLSQNIRIFGEVRDLLAQHFQTLSEAEKEVITWLSINGEPVSFSELRKNISPPMSSPILLEALQSLEMRSLIEKKSAFFFLQPFVTEYVTDRLIQDKISSGSLKSLCPPALAVEISQ